MELKYESDKVFALAIYMVIDSLDSYNIYLLPKQSSFIETNISYADLSM